MKKELCIETMRQAAKRYNLAGAIGHSDRGSQYTSADYKKELKKFGIIQSFSGTGKYYDNVTTQEESTRRTRTGCRLRYTAGNMRKD